MIKEYSLLSVTLYFGGIYGLNIFSLRNILEKKEPPEILITDFGLFSKPVILDNDNILK